MNRESVDTLRKSVEAVKSDSKGLSGEEAKAAKAGVASLEAGVAVCESLLPVEVAATEETTEG